MEDDNYYNFVYIDGFFHLECLSKAIEIKVIAHSDDMICIDYAISTGRSNKCSIRDSSVTGEAAIKIHGIRRAWATPPLLRSSCTEKNPLAHYDTAL